MSRQPGRCMVQGCGERRAFALTVCWAHQGALARVRAMNALTTNRPDGSAER